MFLCSISWWEEIVPYVRSVATILFFEHVFFDEAKQRLLIIFVSANNDFLLYELINPSEDDIPKASEKPMRVNSNHPEHSAPEIMLNSFYHAL